MVLRLCPSSSLKKSVKMIYRRYIIMKDRLQTGSKHKNMYPPLKMKPCYVEIRNMYKGVQM